MALGLDVNMPCREMSIALQCGLDIGENIGRGCLRVDADRICHPLYPEQVLDGSTDNNGGTRHHFVTDAAVRAQLIAFLRSIDDATALFP